MTAPRRSLLVAARESEPLTLGGLALLTLLATTWAIVSGGWNDGMVIAFVTTAVATAEASLIAASGASRLAAATATPLLAILVIVPLTIAGMSVGDDGFDGWRHTVVRFSHAFVVGIVDTDSWSFVVGLCACLWVLAFWVTWMVVRERRGDLAVLPVFATLAANALNAPALDGIGFPEAAALAAALALIARTHLADMEMAWARSRVVTFAGTRRRFSGIAVLGVLGVVAIGTVLPPLSTADVSGSIFHFTVNDIGRGRPDGTGSGSGTDSGSDGSTQDGAAVSYSDSTEPGGTLIDKPRPVLTYTVTGVTAPDGSRQPVANAPTIYLRQSTDVIVRRGSWFPAAAAGRGAARAVTCPGTGGSTCPPIPRDRFRADGGDGFPAQNITVRAVSAAGVDTGHALFPGDPESVDRRGVAYGDDGRGIGGLAATVSSPLLTVDTVAIASGASVVTTVGSVATATESDLRSAGVAYPGWVARGGYTTVGAVGSNDARQIADIRALAQTWVRDAHATDPYDMARALEARLRAGPFTYTLSPPVSADGAEWPIHFFLMTSHAGYCQYYASALGVMLRLLGIPTRLVTGYGPGSLDDSQAGAASPVHRVTTSDAHVWVESYFPGNGWITFEPTPATQVGLYEPILRPIAPDGSTGPRAATPTPTPATAPPTPRPTATPEAAVPGPIVSSGGAGGAIGRALVAILALVAAGFAAGAWISRPRSTAATWRRVLWTGRLLGIRRGVNDTPSSLVARISRNLPPDWVGPLHRRTPGITPGRPAREEAATLLSFLGAAVGRAAFSRDGLTPHDARRCRRTWRRLLRLLPVLIWRRVWWGRRGATTPVSDASGRLLSHD